jgi:hypothetical protein
MLQGECHLSLLRHGPQAARRSYWLLASTTSLTARQGVRETPVESLCCVVALVSWCVYELAYRLASLEVSSFQFSRELGLSETTATPCWDAPGRLLCSALSCSIQLACANTAHHESAPLARQHMAGPATNLVQGFRTGRAVYLEFLRLWTGFELPSSWSNLPCYGVNLNRDGFCVMR